MPRVNFIGQGADVTITRTVTPVSFTSSPNSASRAIGTANGTRIVCVSLVWGENRDLASVTLDGNAMTIVKALASSSQENGCAIAYLAFPTGTTATLAITMSGSGGFETMFEVWAVYDAGGLLDSGTNTTTAGANPIATTIDRAAGGGLLAVATDSDGGASTTWSGATEVTDTNVNDFRYTSARTEGTTVASGATLSATFLAGGGGLKAIVGLTFR